MKCVSKQRSLPVLIVCESYQKDPKLRAPRKQKKNISPQFSSRENKKPNLSPAFQFKDASTLNPSKLLKKHKTQKMKDPMCNAQ